MRFLATFLASLTILALLAGCGSSGGGSSGAGGALILPDPNGLFSGDYQFVGFSGDNSGPEELQAIWGDATADGAGTVASDFAINNTGVVTPAGAITDIDYQVHVDYGFTIGNFGPGAVYARGGISEDGTIAGATTVFDGAAPFLWLYGRRTNSAPNDASIQGTWRFARYTANIAVPLNVTGWGSATFDGTGGGVYEESNNQEGATFGPINPPLSYEVFPSGKVGIQFGADNVVLGSLLQGGNVMFCAGSTVAGGSPSIYVFVRATVGMSNAQFTGNYRMLSFGHEPATNAYATFTGTLFADGTGASQFLGMRNEDGTTTTSNIDGVLYSVAPDGGVTFTTGGGDDIPGAISADGRVVIGAGTSTAGGEPAFVLLFR